MDVPGKFFSVCTGLLLLAALASGASAFAQDGSLPDAPKSHASTAEPYGFNSATLGGLVRNVIHD